jgi:hypothetical protein
MMRSALLVAMLFSLGCEELPKEDTFVVNGSLEREGVLGNNTGEVKIDFASTAARGEWWSCELRLTAEGCVGDRHVNVWLGMPGTESFDQLGDTQCVGDDGQPFGVFELLTLNVDNGDPTKIPADVSALVLVASDIDSDGSADLLDDAETTAASRIVSGDVKVFGIGSFDDPLSIAIDGTTDTGRAVHIEFNGSTSPAPTPPPLDVARTCVTTP